MTWLDVPNKPMVRIATTALAEPARDPGRPYIGQPLGSHQRSRKALQPRNPWSEHSERYPANESACDE
jgi:hypothetical protein